MLLLSLQATGDVWKLQPSRSEPSGKTEARIIVYDSMSHGRRSIEDEYVEDWMMSF